MFGQNWFQATAGEAFAINNSLRFRGAQYLQRTPATDGDRTTFTWSGWVKYSDQAKDFEFLSAGTALANYDLFRFVNNGGTHKNKVEFYSNVNAAYQRSSAQYRDPSAWYHVCGVLDTNNATAGDRLRIYINGERIDSWQNTISLTLGRTMAYFNRNVQHRIGLRAYSTATYPEHWADGYLAECHFVDGTAYGPGTFGEFNADGVWVPKAFEPTITTPRYPENADAPWSYGWSANALNPLYSFDNNLTAGTSVNGVGTATWTGNILATSSIRVRAGLGATSGQVAGNQNLVIINGVDYTQFMKDSNFFLDSGYITIPGNSLNSISIVSIGGVSNPSISAIEIDGQIAVDGDTGYGQNGFYLPFDDPDNIGADRSGNGNNFTATGFELADPSSSNFDWMVDSPTANYSTLNPLLPVTPYVTSDGNLTWSSGSGANNHHFEGTQFSGTGKYYWEVQGANTSALIGAGEPNQLPTTYPGQTATSFGWYGTNGQIYVNTVAVQTIATYTTTDTLGFLLDNDALTCELYKNGVLQTSVSLTGPSVPMVGRESSVGSINFGQRPFIYPPGFSSPTTAFNTVLYTGNDGTNAITGVGFEPDLVWLKRRNAAEDHQLFDSVRGGGLSLQSNATNAEQNAGTFGSFDLDGFTLTGAGQATNNSAGTYVAWCFNAGDGAPVVRTDDAGGDASPYGNMNTTTVKASPENGFAIATWTSDGTKDFIAHDLGVAPNFAIVKSRSSGNWYVYNDPGNGLGYYTTLNSSASRVQSTSFWGPSTRPPTATKFPCSNSLINTSGESYVAYLWANTEDKVSVGYYTPQVGQHINTGFRPAFVMTKPYYLETGHWTISDTTRDPQGTLTKALYPSSANGEDGSVNDIQITSNGFYINNGHNNSGAGTAEMMYIAFAEDFTPDDVKELQSADLEPVAITNPSNHFNTILDTGANILTAAQAKFPNGLWWIKDRASSDDHQLVDSVRGGNLTLNSNLTAAESSYLAPSGDSVAWCWNESPTAGFDIIEYTGTGGSTLVVPHNLGRVPKFFIVKGVSDTGAWRVYNEYSGTGKYIALNSNSAEVSSSWISSVDASNITFAGTGGDYNIASREYIIYAWAEIPGFSSMGSYQGNGNADGPFVALSFRPAYVLTKMSTSAGEWYLQDSARDTYNPVQNALKANLTDQEANNSIYAIDFLSNGFKIRTSNSSLNQSGQTFIYIAFAEHPFGASNVSPSPAR
ncbi:laminin G domain protein [Synechococcus phage S-CRES3]|nr:laminin G domain protein [Synechococcus phage S-CRES3]